LKLLFCHNAFAKLLPAIFVISVGRPALGESASPPACSSPPLDDQGLFVLSIAGREIGKEKFSIRTSKGNIEAKAEIELQSERGGKVFDVKTFPNLVLNSHLQPLTYTWSQKGPQSSSLGVDFRAPPAKSWFRTVTGDEDNREFALPTDVLVLDDNVIHHYQFVVNRYKSTKGGKQTFQAFIPQEAMPGNLTVEESGVGPVQVQGHSGVLQHWVVTTELARVDVYVDDRQCLQLVAIPAAQLEANRKR
jgi:hypothetical protein